MKCPILLITATFVALQLFEHVAAEWDFFKIDGILHVECLGTVFNNDQVITIKKSKLSSLSNGNYSCSKDGADAENLFVYNNPSACLNCVPKDFGGIAGVVIASLTFTILIAVAVYSVSAQDKTWSHQASDRHPLMRNDVNEAVYSHLNNDSRAMYSELGRRARH
ncbi:T-cell surface glycoprotein CD3 delta chain-like isoform X4 [Hemiscyllium ocellatum]|uniref:T-cell surface glycoprotein CD3 delta chain-like isoform X4 n=1 Tax=Hemiscyllium ocellatum TaxID=170820 RepID=UPI002966FA64|nr:T-cell surface glycoprotein CD3 delta chain-like isoform X4 [Hemiscyllium ocellatum]